MRLAPNVTLSARLVSVPSGPAQVRDTLARMREMIRTAKTDPRIIQAAIGISYLTPERDALSHVAALFEWVRDHVRYVMDVHDVETLCDPVQTLARRAGDCDDQTTLLCSLFESIGYPTRLVVAGYTNARDYEHVYCQVLACGVWIDCDPTEDEGIGFAPGGALVTMIERV